MQGLFENPKLSVEDGIGRLMNEHNFWSRLRHIEVGYENRVFLKL